MRAPSTRVTRTGCSGRTELPLRQHVFADVAERGDAGRSQERDGDAACAQQMAVIGARDVVRPWCRRTSGASRTRSPAARAGAARTQPRSARSQWPAPAKRPRRTVHRSEQHRRDQDEDAQYARDACPGSTCNSNRINSSRRARARGSSRWRSPHRYAYRRTARARPRRRARHAVQRLQFDQQAQEPIANRIPLISGLVAMRAICSANVYCVHLRRVRDAEVCLGLIQRTTVASEKPAWRA